MPLIPCSSRCPRIGTFFICEHILSGCSAIFPERSQTLAGLEKLHPRFSRLFQERGQCYVALKQAPEAIEAFLRAVNINPALPASWSMLEGLFRMTRRSENAADGGRARRHTGEAAARSRDRDGSVLDGELAEAEQIIRAFLLKHGHHIEAMRLLARIGIERDVLDDAQLCWRPSWTWRPNIRPLGSTTRRCSASATCTHRPPSRCRSCWLSIRPIGITGYACPDLCWSRPTRACG